MESIEEREKLGKLILVAIDDDEGSINSLQWALNNLSTSHDRIILIHAQHSTKTFFAAGSPGFMVPVEVLRMLEDDAKKAAEKLLAKATEICKAKSLTPKTLVHHGDAREVICNAVKKYNPDMLVLGSRGFGPLKRAVLGSVSDYCAHNVECPVVVVKPQESTAH